MAVGQGPHTLLGKGAADSYASWPPAATAPLAASLTGDSADPAVAAAREKTEREMRRSTGPPTAPPSGGASSYTKNSMRPAAMDMSVKEGVTEPRAAAVGRGDTGDEG